MATWCLKKEQANTFKKALIDGTINPEKLVTFPSSAERRDFFAGIIGAQDAAHVNALFESKLLLKNQQRGIINWAKQVSGMNIKEQLDIVSKVEKLTEVLNPANEGAFLEDFVASRLGVNISMEEAGKISELAKITSEKKTTMLGLPRRKNLGNATDSEMDYGRARVAFGNYVNDLKSEAGKKSITEQLKPGKWGELVVKGAGVAKSLKAAFDNSGLLRQQLPVLWSYPGRWAKNAYKSFKDIWDTFGGKAVMDEIKADIFSRPNCQDYIKDKVAVGTIEESYPQSKLIEKTPGLGKVYEASENAFTGLAYRNRADLYDLYKDIAQKSGIQETTGIGLGKLVNSLTGRGDLGKLEPVASVVNNVLFSPRLLKSHIDVLTMHLLDPNVSTFVKKQAAVNLLKIVMGSAATLALADAISPGSVEKDPRSSDFLKIKVGDTRYDVSGGMGSVITLTARILYAMAGKEAIKSSTTGLLSKLNTGEFGAPTSLDLVYNFFENKSSPAASVIVDLLRGEMFGGEKPTVVGETKNLFTPLIYTTYEELKKASSANMLLSLIADGVGLNVSAYSTDVDWSQNLTADFQGFKDRVGDTRFKKANDKFNQKFTDWFAKMGTNKAFQALTNEVKQKIITNKKNTFKTEIFRENGYLPQRFPAERLPRF